MTTSTRSGLFYGWWIVVVCAIGLFLGAPLLVFSFSVFFKSLVADFHASRAEVSFAFSVLNLVGALWLPMIGMLIDRFGSKRVILPSIVLYGVILIVALWVGASSSGSFISFLRCWGLRFTSGAAPVPYGVVISHWFNRRRGLALSLAMMGIGIGSIVVPIFVQRLIAMLGWRSTFAIFGALVLLIPLTVLRSFVE